MYLDSFFHRLRIAVLWAAAGFLFHGCVEKWEPKPLTVTQLIAGKEQKKWKFSSIEVIDEGTVEGPISAGEIYLPCERDNEYIFKNNEEKTFEFTSGSVKCTNTEPEVLLEHNWSYTTVNSTLEFPLPLALFGGVYILPCNVKKLTETEMVLEIYFSKVFVEEIDASYRITLRSDTSQ
ncbi:hypothetical protein GCM10023091_13170 [Ravibacter arvi]|uniref:Lipocalin-like domain-containing protein n=1 Tax=Ravibacter arvi TaxID=2051041 RepID=A0ABP8LUL5_9BACT